MKKTIVISGGSDGLGLAIARILSSNNNVVILARDEEKLKKAASELNCDYEVCDITLWSQVEKAVNSIINKHKQIDCLINNAGIWIEGELETNDPDAIHKVIEVNYLGQVFLTKAVVSLMKNQKSGSLIFINSKSGIEAKTDRSVYYSSKWAVTGFVKCLQLELTKYGIAVMGIYPDKMNTKLFEKAGINKDMNAAIDPLDVAKTIEFILSFDDGVIFTEVGIKHLPN